MQRWRCPLVLVGLALSAGLGRAQEEIGVPVESVVAGEEVIHGPGGAEGEYGVPGQIIYPHTQTAPPAVTPPTFVGPPSYTPPQYPPLEADPENPRPIRTCLQRFGVGCWAHLNNTTCGSLRSELEFVFGSCRAFFGESCKHGPPVVPIPQGYGPPSTAPWGLMPAPIVCPPSGMAGMGGCPPVRTGVE
jgi:hypothetical protein